MDRHERRFEEKAVKKHSCKIQLLLQQQDFLKTIAMWKTLEEATEDEHHLKTLQNNLQQDLQSP